MQQYAPSAKIKYTLVDQILTPCGFESAKYSLNPYIGCVHGCVYCYARYLLLRRGYKAEDWGRVVYVKSNAISRLKDEIRWKERGRVYLSSATDPYQPIEVVYGITRKLLEILLSNGWPIAILTKSDLALRDRDLFVKFNDIHLGVSISINEAYEIFEPNASSYERRLAVLKEMVNLLGEERVSVFLAPFLPIVSEKSLDGILDDLYNLGVKSIFIDKLNIKSQNWITINRALDEIGISRRDFWRRTKDPRYWNEVKVRFIKKATERNFKVSLFF
ncbi:MAG: radical SAM protein [Crenarchaeota archaeon]|nr:radical SAM protein [Thermoproteota archaeon]MCR8500857.1 radical SAM protein [Thermoproteota archaeon]